MRTVYITVAVIGFFICIAALYCRRASATSRAQNVCASVTSDSMADFVANPVCKGSRKLAM